MTNVEKASRSCYVAIRGRRGFTLTNFILADHQFVSGRLEDGTLTTVKLRDGVKVSALATDCEGATVGFEQRCTCNRSQARVHDVAQKSAWVPPTYVSLSSENKAVVRWVAERSATTPAKLLGSCKSFADLRQIVGRSRG